VNGESSEPAGRGEAKKKETNLKDVEEGTGMKARLLVRGAKNHRL